MHVSHLVAARLSPLHPSSGAVLLRACHRQFYRVPGHGYDVWRNLPQDQKPLKWQQNLQYSVHHHGTIPTHCYSEEPKVSCDSGELARLQGTKVVSPSSNTRSRSTNLTPLRSTTLALPLRLQARYTETWTAIRASLQPMLRQALLGKHIVDTAPILRAVHQPDARR